MAVYTNSQPIVGAYGDIYTADVGTPAPMISDWDTMSGWDLLGMISEDGCSWTPPSESTSDINIWQSMYPARVVTTGLSSSMAFALDGWDRTTIPFALGGGTFEDLVDTVLFHPPGPGESMSKAIFLKVIDATVKLGLYFPKGRVTGRDDVVFKRDEAALLHVTFSLEGSTMYDPYQLVFDPVTFPAAGAVTVVATATAGAPGTWNPSGGEPASAAALLAAQAGAYVASPTSAWTTGQSVPCGSDSAHWTGSAWASGVTP